MSVATLTPPTDLHYFIPPKDGSKPIVYVNRDINFNDPGTKNYETKPFKANVENVRGTEAEYKLDQSGFEFHQASTSLSADDFNNEDKIKNIYYQEVIDTIKRFTGASKVVVFDHTLRNNDPNPPTSQASRRKTADRVHVDQTPSAAARRVTRHLPASEADSRLKGRYQIINLWRPIRHEAYDRPLALCDYRSLDHKKDLVPTILQYPDYSGETYSVNYNPNHRWKYLKGMTPDEAILIKCADSITDGSVAICTPHTAFDDPTKPGNTKFRESIEVRTLVFYD